MTHIPGGILADKFGGKHTLGFGMFLSSVFTMLAPSAARQGYEYLVLTRVITGLGEVSIFIVYSGKCSNNKIQFVLGNHISCAK